MAADRTRSSRTTRSWPCTRRSSTSATSSRASRSRTRSPRSSSARPPIPVSAAALLLYGLAALADRGAIAAPLSREAIFLFQNVLFVAATLTVLLGTLYPLIAEALSGAQLSIGAPYFDRVEVPIGLALLFLMGLGPQLPWHGASRATLERQFTAPLVAAALGAGGAILTGLP